MGCGVASDPFDFSKSLGVSTGDIVKNAKTGLKIGRSISAWNLRRSLERQGYDPLTIEAAVEARKTGRNPAAILQRAKEAYAIRDRQAEMRANPPPIHGSARWADATDLGTAGLFLPPDRRRIGLGTFDGDQVSWDGESHLLTVAPTRTGKSALQIIPTLLAYEGSAVVLDPKGELYRYTARWRAQNVGPVHAINPFDMPGIPATSAFNPLDGVTDSQSALELAELLYPRTHDEKQQFFENEAIAFLAAAVEFTVRDQRLWHRIEGVI